MTLSYVLLQNLRRNPLRTALTAVAFALPMAVFVLALSLVVGFVRTSAALEQELRLGVHHRVSLTNFLPDGHRRKIEELDPQRTRLRAVCGMRWFGGRVPGTQQTLQSLAADVDTLPVVYSDIGLTPFPLTATGEVAPESAGDTPPAAHYLVCRAERDLMRLLPVVPELARAIERIGVPA